MNDTPRAAKAARPSICRRAWVLLKLVGVHIIGIFFILEALVKALLPRCLLRRDIKGEVVLVTGSASGLGRQMALRLALKGAKVVLWDVNAAGLEKTKDLILSAKGECHAYALDLRDKSAIYRTAALVKQDVGKVDVLVNNAGLPGGTTLLDSSDDQIRGIFEVNVLSHFWTIKAFLPEMMRENHGHIMGISSIGGLISINKMVDYSASKFAIVGLMEGLKMELYEAGKTGVYTTVICPYFVNTGMAAGVTLDLVPMLEEEYVANEIVDGILMRKHKLLIPSLMMNLLLIFKSVFPTKTVLLGLKVAGVTRILKTYEAPRMKGGMV